jgi:hypothetical protein
LFASDKKFAFCRGSEGGLVRWGREVQAGRRKVSVGRSGGASGMHGGRPRLGEGPTRGLAARESTQASEHGAHVRDLGGVENAEWLVELKSRLPSRKEGTRCGPGWAGGRVQSSEFIRAREAAGRVCGAIAGSASGMRGEGPTQGLGGTEGTRGAHGEHGAHARDLGGVEAAERLVE